MARAHERVDDAHAAQRDAAAQSANAGDMLRHQAWIEHSEQIAASSVEDLGREEREVARRRGTLTAAARERKALDRLEARRRSDFDRDVARNESRDQDEIALNVFRAGAA
jgi:flagellar export protein FliJ